MGNCRDSVHVLIYGPEFSSDERDGMAEAGVKIAKFIASTARSSYLALLEYRKTEVSPLTKNNYSHNI